MRHVYPGLAPLTSHAQTLASAGDLSGAHALLADALAPVDVDPQRADPEVAAAAALHARVSLSLGDPHEARAWARFAHAAQQRLHGPHDERTLGSAATHAAVLHRLGSHTRAAQLYRGILAHLTAVDGPDSGRVLAGQADLAIAEHAAGHCTSARRRLADAWQRHRQASGDAAATGIKMLARLGAMERECGQAARAQEHLTLAQELCARYLPADHPLSGQVTALAATPTAGTHVCRTPDRPGAEPQQTAEHEAGPGQTAGYGAGPGQAAGYEAGPQQAAEHEARPEQAAEHEARPEQAAEHEARPEQPTRYDVDGRATGTAGVRLVPVPGVVRLGPPAAPAPERPGPQQTAGYDIDSWPSGPAADDLYPGIGLDDPDDLDSGSRRPLVIAGITIAVLLAAALIVTGGMLLRPSPRPDTAGSGPARTGPARTDSTAPDSAPPDSPPATGDPAGAGASTAASVPGSAAPGAPAGVSLRDARDNVTLRWRYPDGAEGPVLISGGRAGQQARAFQQLPAGTADYAVYGLNEGADYCFTVAVVYSTERVATSAPVCTHRAPAR